MNYLIILFKDRKQRKVIKKFNTLKRAEQFFKEKISESNKILFDKTIENGIEVDYELALVGHKGSERIPVYKRDELGRTMRVEIAGDDREFIEIQRYRLPEKIYHVGSGRRITLIEFVTNFLPKVGIKMVSKLNHKIIVQRDLELDVFSLKSGEESDRFINILVDFFLKENRMDTIFVKDCSRQQRKFLYETLTERGYTKQALYRRFTTHPSKR